MKALNFQSPLNEFIVGLIHEKQSLGYDYSSSAWALYKFDLFCLEFGCDSTITKDLMDAWITKRPNESIATLHNRVGVVRQLALYMARLGKSVYLLPDKSLPKTPHYSPYIFSETEIVALFKQIDTCRYCALVPFRHMIMPLLFRLLFGCGLRVSEALNLRLRDVDIESGVLTVFNGKFNKDRLVPMSLSNKRRCEEYLTQVHLLSEESTHLFPGSGGRPITRGNVYKNFRRFLRQAGISHGGWGKGPRVHDARHTYSVNCLKRWVLEGKDLAVYLPILKTYLGHYSFQDTAQYLRLTAELYPDITAKIENTFGDIVPAIEGFDHEAN